MHQGKSHILGLSMFVLGLAILSAEGGVTRRGLQFLGANDDDTGFHADFTDNVTLRSSDARAFCFSHRVGCVEYNFRVVEMEGNQPVTVLGFVAPKRAARRAEEEHEINGDDVVKGSICAQSSCDLSNSIDTDDDEDMCVVLVNSDFEFINSTDIEGFRQDGSSDVSIELKIKSCRTTTQMIVAIAVPVAVFVGVAGCFSAWWIRRRRKEYMAQNVATPANVVNMAPLSPHVLAVGQSYPPGYVPTAISSPRREAGTHPMTGAMGHAQEPKAAAGPNTYPMNYAHV